MADSKKTTKKKASVKASAEKKTPKPASAAPVSKSSAGAAARMGVKQYVRYRPDRSWAVPLVKRTEQKTLGEWDAWYQAILSSPAK